MKMQAAVLWATGEDWSIEEVELDGPGPGEVLVRYVAAGLCHSDDHARTGDLPIELPAVGGHEGAGVVEEVGAGVTSLKPGDHVVASFIPACGRCKWCAIGRQNLCDLGALITVGSLDGTHRRHIGDRDVRALSLVGTFAPYGTVSEASLVRIEPDIPLERACLVSCGVTTGVGAAVHTAGVTAGDTVVVIGCGGIGTSAVQGARIAGAERIVAVDIAADKQETVQALGATHFVTSMEEAHELVAELTRGVMADAALLTVGVVHGEMIAPLLGLVRKAGTAVVTGLTPATETQASLSLLELTLFQKSLRGTLFGEANPRADIDRMLSLYRQGLLKLDEMVTREYRLPEINEGYADMLGGRIIRGVVRHEH